MLSRKCALVIAVAATLIGAGGALGQEGPCYEAPPQCVDPRASEVASHLRATAELTGRMDLAQITLIQGLAAQPPKDLEALADSVVEVGVSLATRVNADGQTIGDVASLVLIGAFTYRPHGRPARGVPFLPAIDRLVELAYRLPGGEPGVLAHVRTFIGDEAWFGHMRAFATSDLSPGASLAIWTLEWDGPSGIEVLRGLYEEGLVTQSQARARLREVARDRAWR